MDERPIIVIPGDQSPGFLSPSNLAHLRSYGDLRIFDPPLRDLDEFVRRTEDATIIVNSTLAIPAEIFGSLPKLKMIVMPGVGTDLIPLEEAEKRGIVVANVPNTTSYVVAEHAIALMLGVAKQLAYQTAAIRSGRWEEVGTLLVRGKTLGIIGTGGIGTQVARLGNAFGMHVIAWTMHPSLQRAEALGVSYLEVDELLQDSEVIIICIPLTSTTHHLIGQREFEIVKSGVILVNVSRGKIVNQDALVAALNTGKVGGAGLDVFEEEPVPADSPLLKCKHLVLTPHVGGTTPEAIALIDNGVVENIIAFLEGRPQNLVQLG
jgi:phosphoglycerate dehydrogenase-like enzyme